MLASVVNGAVESDAECHTKTLMNCARMNISWSLVAETQNVDIFSYTEQDCYWQWCGFYVLWLKFLAMDTMQHAWRLSTDHCIALTFL